MSDHAIVHVEFSANNLEAAGTFYADLFGWQVTQVPEMSYATFAAAGGPGGGFAKVDDGAAAGQVLVYVHADDIDAALAKAESLGGKTLVPTMEIPQIGWMGIFEDPTGNKVGLFKSM